MKKLILIFILLISFSAFAQENERMKERIKAQKIAFITEKLELTSKEAQGFWPIYNEFEAKTDKVKNEDLRAIRTKMRKDPGMSEAEASELIVKLIKAEEDLHAAKIKLVNDLKTVISSVKILKLKAAEEQFNKKLLERLRDMRERRANKN